MTAPTTSLNVTVPPLRGILRTAARQVRVESDDANHIGWIMSRRVCALGRGPGWVVIGTRRLLWREMMPAGSVHPDDDSGPDGDGRPQADVIATLQPERPKEYATDRLPPVCQARLVKLSGVLSAVELAERCEVTPRRAQQKMAAAAERVAQSGLFFLAGGQVGGV